MQVLSHCLSLQLSSLLQTSLWSQCRWYSCWSRSHRGRTLWACPPSSHRWSGCRPWLLLNMWSWADDTTTLGASRYNDGLCSWYHFSIGRTCSGLLGSSGDGIVTTSFCRRLVRGVERCWCWPGTRLLLIHRFTSCRTAAGFLWMVSFSSLSWSRKRRGRFHPVSFFSHWRRWRMGSLAFLGRWGNLLSRSRSSTAFVVMMSMLLSLLFCPLLLLCSCTGSFLFLQAI